MNSRGDSNGERAGGCAAPIDHGDPALPVAGTGRLSQVRKSSRGKWRAAVLIGVHLLIAAHVTHFLVARRTLSPVEPSESMYTLARGELNAGFLFFVVALLATLVFGRWFCGWGCHLVALQDLCGWIMKKLGIRPQPFRSRLLLWAPLGAALYMFAWPVVGPRLRAWAFGEAVPPFPGFSNHLLTDGFWDTFPPPLFAALTFVVCGFAAVYLLGAKGFCTYACPYGGLFAPLDRLAPMRVRVTDACTQCGHCTAVCTSNVRVHEEVKQHGMVVDPGCMKCTDCVSVCPTGALYVGFGRPAVGSRPRGVVRERRHPLSLGEELLVAAVCLAATATYDGYYARDGGLPLLLSVCLGALTGFVVLRLGHLVSRPRVALQGLRLKSEGRLRAPGIAFAALGGAWLLFTVHGAFLDWQLLRARAALERTEAPREEVLAGRATLDRYSEEHRRAAASAGRRFGIVERYGLFDVVEVKLGLAWTSLLAGDVRTAETRIREAVALAPAAPMQRDNLYRFLLAQERIPEAIEVLRDKIDLGRGAPADSRELAELLILVGREDEAGSALERVEGLADPATELFRLGARYADAGRAVEAIRAWEACVRLRPDVFEARYNLGGLYRRTGSTDDAVRHLLEARALRPEDPDTHVELGLALAEAGRTEEAIESLERAIALAPERPEALYHLPGVIEALRAR